MENLYRALFSYVILSNDDPEVRVELMRLAVEVPNFAHQKYANLILESYDKSKQINSAQFLYDNGFTIELSNDFTAADVKYVIGEIKERSLSVSIKRELQSAINKDLPLSDLIKETARVIHTAGGNRTLAYESISVKEAYMKRKEAPLGIFTGIKQIDDITLGLDKGTMSIWGGYVGSFKTTTMLNVLYKNVTNLRYNALMVLLESPENQLMYQLLSRHSFSSMFSEVGEPVPSQKIMKGLLTEEEEKFIFGPVFEDLTTNPEYGKFKIVEERFLPSMDHKGVLQYADRNLDFEVDWLGINYVQLLQYQSHAHIDSRINSPGNYYVREFTRMALDFHGKPIHVALNSQFNREGWKKAVAEEGRYDLTAFSEINALERDAAYAIALFSDPILKESGEVSCQLLKNRLGEVIEDPFRVVCRPQYSLIGGADLYTPEVSGTEGFDALLAMGNSMF